MKGFTVFSTVSITFETTYELEDTSQLCLALTGSTFELGNWDVNNCVTAKESPVGSGHWTTTVELPAKDKFYWKWMVVPMDRSEVIRWEEIENREECSGDRDCTITAMWNGPSVRVTYPDNGEQGFRIPAFIHSVTNLLFNPRRQASNAEPRWCEIL